MRKLINYYYDLTETKEYTTDDEGCLVQLCRTCAGKSRQDVQWAARGDEESHCELCDKPQEEA